MTNNAQIHERNTEMMTVDKNPKSFYFLSNMKEQQM